jgi:hypothetical protein
LLFLKEKKRKTTTIFIYNILCVCVCVSCAGVKGMENRRARLIPPIDFWHFFSVWVISGRAIIAFPARLSGILFFSFFLFWAVIWTGRRENKYIYTSMYVIIR